jgi:hypothetical protein
LDSASPKLILACNQGSSLGNARLEFIRIFGKAYRYYVVELANVKVTSVTSDGSGASDFPNERVTLHYDGIESIYTELDPDLRLLPDAISWWVIPDNYGGTTAVECVTAIPDSLTGMAGTTGQLTIQVPPLLNAVDTVGVKVVSSDPTVLTFPDATDGQKLIPFPGGTPPSQTIDLLLLRPGRATVTMVRQQTCIANSAAIEVRAGLIANASFEENLPDGPSHYGSINHWPALGAYSGVSPADGPFQDNGTIPDRTQVAFIQSEGSLSQDVTGLEPGRSYWLQFRYNARACCGGTIGLTVRFDGEPLAAVSPVLPVGDTNPYHWTNLLFTPKREGGRLEFATTAAGDASLLLDAVSLVRRDATSVVLHNPSFEASGTPPTPGYLESGQLEGWTTTGKCGVNEGWSGAFADNGIPPDQARVAFLQQAGASLSQDVGGLTPGQEYTLTFAANARSGNLPHLKVTLAGAVLIDEDIAPVGSANPYRFKAATFRAPARRGMLRFEQTAPTGDNTVLLDNIEIVPGPYVPAPIPLRVQFAGTTGLRLSWPMTPVAFRLQAATFLGGAWHDVPEPLQVEGVENVVYQPLGGQSQYFRLRW